MKLKKIIPCCTPVLPTVYDESLSYYELLCKITKDINTLINIYNNVDDTIIQEVNNWLNEHYAELLLNAFYDEGNEQIIFSTAMKNLDIHTYNGTDTMSIIQSI